MKTVICKSGIKGWQQSLRKNYNNNLAQFKAYCDTYQIHSRLGYSTPEEAWEANPVIQGSTNPGDLRVVKEETAVMFRKFKDGEIIALFPYEPERTYGTCNSYMHIGQHGTADLSGIIGRTMPATEEEYEDLYLELVNYGPAEANYNLKVIKRVNNDLYRKAWEKQNRR